MTELSEKVMLAKAAGKYWELKGQNGRDTSVAIDIAYDDVLALMKDGTAPEAIISYIHSTYTTDVATALIYGYVFATQ